MALLMKEKIPALPDQAPEVIEARRQKEAAIKVQTEARAARDTLRRILNNSDGPPAARIRARGALADAEASAEIAELEANEKQRVETVRLQEATQAWRPGFEGRFRETLRGLYEALEKHVIPANEEVRRVWLEAYSLGVELPPHFWLELFPTDNGGGGVESLFVFRQHVLRAEGWL